MGSNHDKDIVYARLISNKNKNYDICREKVSFYMPRKKNNIRESITKIRSLCNKGNKENDEAVFCIKKLPFKRDNTISPFIFRANYDNIFLINKKAVKKDQRRILLSNDVIEAVNNSRIYFTFKDLRPIIDTGFPREMMKDYFVEGVLGNGASGTIYLVKNVETLNQLALKQVVKAKKNELKRDVAFEAKLMSKLNHPNIVRLVDFYDKPDCTFIFTEFLNTQDLLFIINDKPNYRLDELEAKVYFRQIADGLKYLHDLNICHLDIKCDNIFVNKVKNVYTCKIGDFGLSCYDNNLSKSCGTLFYSPPEMLINGKLYKGTKCDIWSFGVVLFAMISGNFPFHESLTNSHTLKEQITRGIVRFRDDEIWNSVSYECKHLICCMINPNPFLRFNIYEILNHMWLQNDSARMNQKKRSKKTNCSNDFIAKRLRIKI